MKQFKQFILIVLTLLLLLLSVSSALALNGCPKGKTFCDHPCGDFIDTNGNMTCDRIESSTDQNNAASGTEENPVYPSNNNFPGSDVGTGTAQGHSSGSTNTTSSPYDETNNEPYATEEQTSDDLSNAEQSSTADESSTTVEENVQTQASNPATESFFSALTEPIFIVTLLLLLAAFLLTQLNYSLTARLGFLALGLVTLGFYFKGCMCPVGVLANLPLHLAGILTGQYMLWLLLLLLPIVFIFFAGRIYCSGVCPFGAVQEFTFRLGSKLGLNQGFPGLQKLPWLKYFKYLILLAIFIVTPLVGTAWWCEIDPFGYLFNFTGTKIALTILIGLLILSLFISRPWCRIFCPYGALLGILNKDISLLKAQFSGGSCGPAINQAICKNCGKCAKTCPTDAIQKNTIDLTECINCGECSQQCKLAAIN